MSKQLFPLLRMCVVGAHWTSLFALTAVVLLAAGGSAAEDVKQPASMRTIDSTWPAPPGEESWGFVEDLKKPLPFILFWKDGSSPQPGQINLRAGVTVNRGFPDEKGILKTAYADLESFMAFAKLAGEGGLPVTTEKVAMNVPESYSIEVSPSGIRLLAGDTEGIRRAIFHLEEMIATADGPFLNPGVILKKPWLRHRITRCFFGPIKRPPLNRDELMDDVDYYPDAYLNRLAHEGVNGLWLSIEWKDITETSFRKADPNMERRLAKLRKTVDKCAGYGIKVWLYTNEPVGFYSADDPMLEAHPELAGAGWPYRRYVCPNSEASQKFIYESTHSIFSRVRGLGGVINISLGEHGTSCLDSMGAEVDRRPDCPRCSRVPNWQTLAAGQGAMARGIKEGDPNAEYICWLYMPAWRPLAPWVYELGAHMPKDVTLQVNFESGAVKYQLDRPRVGGDYWLSFVGPSERFARIAWQAAAHKTPMSAKLQVACSHESATIPFMPVPSILYRKYKEMPALNITSVMQCWYFGNYPGVMNRAAGRLAFEDFSGTEDDFLRTLARAEWGLNAEKVVRAWKHFAEGFQHFPLSTRFQWWGPMHATPVWPLHLKPALKPLQPTWLVGGPSGDAIGEALDNHSLPEAVILSRKMSGEWDKGVAILKSLEPGIRGNRERMLDIGLTEAIGIQFASAHNMLNFYLMRGRLFDLLPADALRHLAAMEAIVRQEIQNSQRLDVLCTADSRLGFHSEAERHQYCGTRLKWRVAVLNDLLATEFPEYRAAFAAGKQVSRFAEGRAVYACGSGWTDCRTYRWQAESDNGSLVLRVEMKASKAPGSFTVYLCDPFMTAHYWEINFSTQGTVSDSREIGLGVESYTTPDGAHGITMRIPSEGLLLLDPSGRAYAFNIFNSRLVADNWPTGMDESDLGKYRLALSGFNPRKMGYLRMKSAE
ncbi:MAG: hypothetical protein KA354_05680 [Phycisphaerae bacterium]|nr:hypothetical protein [Phycisphaerae bacterium]